MMMVLVASIANSVMAHSSNGDGGAQSGDGRSDDVTSRYYTRCVQKKHTAQHIIS